ncbi:MAG: DUF99 family protein [Acidiferrobacterales bacterium]
MTRRLSHVIGFDDAPFARTHRGDVLIVGALYSGLRLEGVLSAKVRRDGANSTSTLVRLLLQSRFKGHIQIIMLQGIAFAGFNVIDLHRLHESLRIPAVVIARKPPDLNAIKRALLHRVPGGKRKWALIERAGPMERVGGVYVQRTGLSLKQVDKLLGRFAIHSAIPEPLRVAHLIAGGIETGESRHRP